MIELKSKTRTELIRFIEEARTERDGLQRDLWKAIEDRNVAIDEAIHLRKIITSPLRRAA